MLEPQKWSTSIVVLRPLTISMTAAAVNITYFKYIKVKMLSDWSYTQYVCWPASVSLMSGGPVERGGSEEEAGGPPGEHIKPDELLQINMDGKALHLYE